MIRVVLVTIASPTDHASFAVMPSWFQHPPTFQDGMDYRSVKL